MNKMRSLGKTGEAAGSMPEMRIRCNGWEKPAACRRILLMSSVGKAEYPKLALASCRWMTLDAINRSLLASRSRASGRSYEGRPSAVRLAAPHGGLAWLLNYASFAIRRTIPGNPFRPPQSVFVWVTYCPSSPPPNEGTICGSRTFWTTKCGSPPISTKFSVRFAAIGQQGEETHPSFDPAGSPGRCHSSFGAMIFGTLSPLIIMSWQ